jgi:hypothetical protein
MPVTHDFPQESADPAALRRWADGIEAKRVAWERDGHWTGRMGEWVAEARGRADEIERAAADERAKGGPCHT